MSTVVAGADLGTLSARVSILDTFQGSYTHTRTYDYGYQYPDVTNFAQYWAPSNFEVPNRFSLTESFDLPRLQNWNPVLRAVIGGWVVSGTEGSEQRNRFSGPGFADWDCGVLKNFRFTEHVRFQLRFELFNVLNHPNLNGVVSDLSSGSFGKSTATFNPRYLQVGAKLNF